MFASLHSQDSERNARLAAFGVTADQVARVVDSFAVKGSAAIVVARSAKKVWVGQANGDCLVAIVRNGKVVTFVVTRSGQLRPEHFRVEAVL